jgi:hypothetical protein
MPIHARDRKRQFKPEVREGVRHRLGQHPPGSREWRVRERRRRLHPRPGRQRAHTAEQPTRWTPHQQHAALLFGPEDGAVALRLGGLGELDGKALRVAHAIGGAILGQRTSEAARCTRGAHRRSEIHHRLREIARAGVGGDAIGRFAKIGHRAGQRALNREQPCDHARDIGIDHHRARAKGDRGDRGGGIGSDAGQRAQSFFGVGKATALGHGAGAGVQIAGAGIIAKPRPGRHQIGLGRGGERLHRGPARYKFRETRAHRRDRGLLQHDFGQPHAVGIGCVAAGGGAPRQIAGMRIIPGEQSGGDGGRTLGGHRIAMAWTGR